MVSANLRFVSQHAVRTMLLAGIGLTAACTTDNVGLAYKPTTTIVAPTAAPYSASVGSFVDQRGESPTWLGAIRGGYGNPVKTLDATPSVAALVQAAFTDGLKARHVPASGTGRSYQIAGVIKKLDCSQYARREAHVEIDVTVFDGSTGKQVFTRTYAADSLEGSLLSLKTGVFASVETLRALAEKTLAQVVDKALDDSALTNSMRS